jgi:hypothetical protein
MSSARRLEVRRRAELGVIAGYLFELASPRRGRREQARGRRRPVVAATRARTPVAEGA